MRPAIALIGLVVLAGCHPPAPSRTKTQSRPPAWSQPRELMVAYQANLLGEIEPCG